MERKKPVFVLCNARNGTLLFYGIEKWSNQLTKDQRKEFVKDMKAQPSYLEAKTLAYFETAQQWLSQKKIKWFTHATKNVKVSSWSRTHPIYPVERLPRKFGEMLEKGIDFVVADVSSHEFPGSFGKGYGTEENLSGYKELFQENDYKVELISRRTSKRETFHSTKEILQRAPKAVMINPLKQFDIYYYAIDNKPQVIGWLGKKFAHDQSERLGYIGSTVETNRGEIDFSEYAKIKIREHCQKLKEKNNEAKQ